MQKVISEHVTVAIVSTSTSAIDYQPLATLHLGGEGRDSYKDQLDVGGEVDKVPGTGEDWDTDRGRPESGMDRWVGDARVEEGIPASGLG
jgi:hypothetical protein